MHAYNENLSLQSTLPASYVPPGRVFTERLSKTLFLSNSVTASLLRGCRLLALGFCYMNLSASVANYIDLPLGPQRSRLDSRLNWNLGTSTSHFRDNQSSFPVFTAGPFDYPVSDDIFRCRVSVIDEIV